MSGISVPAHSATRAPHAPGSSRIPHATLALAVALALACSLAMSLAGCAPAQDGNTHHQATQTTGRPKPVGAPWKSWFISGTLTEKDDVRCQDDYFCATNRAWLLERNKSGVYSDSAADERADEIADEMYELVAKGGDKDHDVANLRALLALFEDWNARDKDGLEPIRPLVERLLAIHTLDELTAWFCSTDARNSLAWRADEGGTGLFCLEAYNDVSDIGDESETPTLEEGYTLSIYQGDASLAPFALEDTKLEDDDNYFDFLDAAARIEVADYLLWRLGVDDDASWDLIWDAVDLDCMIEAALEDTKAVEAQYAMAELNEKTRGGFPVADIACAYGYDDATVTEVDDLAWLDALGELYTEKNVHLFVAHELVGLLADEATYLDGDAYDATFDLDGTSYLPDYLIREGDDHAWSTTSIEDDPAWLEAESRRADIEAVGAALPTTYAKVYVEHFFDEKEADEVRDLVKQVTDEYEEMLAGEEWLGEETRVLAIDKLRAIRTQVGHPSVWPDTDHIRVRTRGDGATLFDEVRRLRGMETDDEQQMLLDTSLTEYWAGCMDVNTYYEPGTNAIFICAGFMGGAYWDKDMSFEEKLGAMGTTIGHEISHAFDSDGAYLDKYGRSNLWWTDEDLAAFEERVKRVEAALETIDPLGMGGYDGERVCAEAIADLGGMRVCDRIAATHKDFDYDAYFGSFARSWVSVSTRQDSEDQLAEDVHPLDRDRVNVPLRESDAFLATYGVTEGDTMWLDPEERVSVW